MKEINPDLDFTEPHIKEESGVNIDSAEAVLARAEGGEVNVEEVNETIKTLQQLQNDGINNPKIQTTLARLIAVRGE